MNTVPNYIFKLLASIWQSLILKDRIRYHLTTHMSTWYLTNCVCHLIYPRTISNKKIVQSLKRGTNYCWQPTAIPKLKKYLIILKKCDHQKHTSDLITWPSPRIAHNYPFTSPNKLPATGKNNTQNKERKHPNEYWIYTWSCEIPTEPFL